jgi:hypothetical protein
MRTRSSPLLTAGIAAACVCFVSAQEERAADPAASALPLLTADVAVERSIVQDDGTLVHQLPGVRYRLTQVQTPTGRRSIVTFDRAKAFPTTGPLADPFAGVTVEFDEPGGPLRVYDAKRQLLPNPIVDADLSRIEPPRPAPSDATGELVTRPAGIPQRRQRLQRDLGRAVGQVRGLDRYLSTQGEVTHEVLVAPTHAVPLEVNLVRHGILESHLTYDYQVLSDGSWLRRASRSESRVPGHSDQRLVTLTTFSNVSAEAR